MFVELRREEVEEAQPKWTEDDQIIVDTAAGLHASNMEGLRLSMETLRVSSASELRPRVNPFTHEDATDAWELVKLGLGLVLVPLRIFLILFMLMSFALFLRLTMIGRGDPSLPMGRARFACQRGLNALFGRAALLCMGVTWISYKGKCAPSTSARMVVVAPHSTWVDGFLVTYCLDMTSVVSKKEVTKNPLMAVFLHACDAILVDRTDKSSKKSALDEIVQRVQSPLNYRHLTLFPEGTCTNRRALINFKHGAFVPGRPVQPVLLRWAEGGFDPSWTAGGPNRTYLILRFLSQLWISVTVEFLPVYTPNDQEITNPTLFAEGVRDVMAQSLGLPVTEHSYEDSFLAKAARKHGLRGDRVLPYEFVALRKQHEISYEDAMLYLRRFAEAKKRRRAAGAAPRRSPAGPNPASPSPFASPAGPSSAHVSDEGSRSRLDVSGLSILLGLPVSDPVVELFSYLDVKRDGYVDLTAFTVGALHFRRRPEVLEAAVRVVWKSLDRKNEGVVTMLHIRNVLDRIFQRSSKSRALPLFREIDKRQRTLTFEDLLQAFRKHPEFVPLALHVTSLSVQDRRMQRLSARAAKLKINMKESAMIAAAPEEFDLEKGSPQQPPSAAAAANKHVSFVPRGELAQSSEMPVS